MLRTSFSIVLLCSAAYLTQCYADDPSKVDIDRKNLPASTIKPTAQASAWPYSQVEIKTDNERIESILEAMSVEDKVGQLVMAEIRHVNPSDVKRYRLGGILNGGGAYPNNNKHATAKEWVDLADKFYQASIDRKDNQPKIPVLWGTDAVHGHNNVFGATIFPHNIGLGATRNPDLLKKIGEITAKEVSATGIYWTFAPTVTVPMDDRWGRTYEGYSEDQNIVSLLGGAMIDGLQGELGENFLSKDKVAATAKHFIGDGGTHKGKDQGDTKLNEAGLSKYHGQGYVTALQKGTQSVMASFNSWNGKKIHGDEYLLTEVLKNKMGFDGFVVGDWNGHGQVPGCTNADCSQSINAGVDMIMVPEEWQAFYKNTLKQARSGRITKDRLNDAVRRILRVKMRLGMFDDSGPRSREGAGIQSVIGHPSHRAIARQAVQESLVLLKNNNNVLPIKANSKVLVAGEAAQSLANQLGGWSMTWQGTETSAADFPGATSVLDGIKESVKSIGGKFEFSELGKYLQKPDVAIVIFSEPPYAEGQGDRDNLAFSPNDRRHLDTLRKLKAEGIPTVGLFMSGRPMWVNPEINASDAFIAAWLPGTEGQGVADVLFCEKIVECGFKGKLSFSWPRDPKQSPLNNIDSLYDPLFKVGYGLKYGEKSLVPVLEEKAAVQTSAIGQVIFKGRGIGGISAVIQEQGGAPQSASQPPAKTKNGGVSTAVFDRIVQEDAQRIRFNGQGLNSWQLQSDKKLAWENEAKQSANLALDLKVVKANDQPIFFSLVCGSGCNGSLPVDEVLRNNATNDWQSYSIALSCFEKLGADLNNVTHPLVILTPGAWEIEVTNVRLDKQKGSNHIACPLQ